MKYETPILDVLIVDDELFMQLSVNTKGDAGEDDTLDFENW